MIESVYFIFQASVTFGLRQTSSSGVVPKIDRLLTLASVEQMERTTVSMQSYCIMRIHYKDLATTVHTVVNYGHRFVY